MALLLPANWLPVLVAVALIGVRVSESLTERRAFGRSLLAISDAWFAVGPCAVLVAAPIGAPDWGDWPILLAAFGAQLLVDVAVACARARAGLRMPVRLVLPELRFSLLVDVLLTPVGVLVAIAAARAPGAALLVLPLVAFIALLAREREARLMGSVELGRAYRGTARVLHDILEEDDAYTASHSQEVVELAMQVADDLGTDDEVRREAELGALLHDVGKLAIPDAILNKRGPLDPDEWAVMKTHTIEGQRLLDRVGGLLAAIGVVVRASHEHYDGTGYPDGLAGEAIPIAARITSACDAYHAMTTDRCYRKALPLHVAWHELRSNAGNPVRPARRRDAARDPPGPGPPRPGDRPGRGAVLGRDQILVAAQERARR